MQLDCVRGNPALSVLVVEEPNTRHRDAPANVVHAAGDGIKGIEPCSSLGDMPAERTGAADAIGRRDLGDHGSAHIVAEDQVIVGVRLLLEANEARTHLKDGSLHGPDTATIRE